MPHKLLERQYQQQAQRRHEENQRQDFYRRAARYFERESAAARQFTSWTQRCSDSYAEWLERRRKEERLQARRERLRQLLEQEEQLYKRELEALQSNRLRRSVERLSLEEFRRRLLERKAEESLYYPSSCRRLRSYGFAPVASPSSSSPSSSSPGRSADLRNGNDGPADAYRHDSSSPPTRNSNQARSLNDTKNTRLSNNRRAMSESPKPTYSSCCQQNLRFAARGSEVSLSNTNIRDQHWDSTTESLKTKDPQRPGEDLHDDVDSVATNYSDENPVLEVNDFDQQTDPRYDMTDEQNQTDSQERYNGGTSASHSDAYQNAKQNERHDFVNLDNANQHHWSEHRAFRANDSTDSPSRHEQVPEKEEVREEAALTSDEKHMQHFEDRNHASADNSMGNDPPDRPGDVHHVSLDSTMQLYRYLKHRDLKAKILDLCQREEMFVTKQSWDEALRLREMRNELLMIKNRNLYGNRDLDMDEETRNEGLKIIEAREALQKKRAKMCNSLVYSDEARDLWKQWVHEDDKLARVENDDSRELFLAKLEEEWNALATHDQQRVTKLYERVMKHSELQDEHNLAAAFRAASERQKYYANSIDED